MVEMTLTKFYNNAQKSTGILFINGEQKETFLAYDALFNKALKLLGALQSKGLNSGAEVVFQVSRNEDFLVLFWACILGKMIPIPIAVAINKESQSRFDNVLNILSNPWVVYDDKSNNKGYGELSQAIELSVLDDHSNLGEVMAAKPNDIAFIQFSSGSTGTPKGVVLTHENVCSNIQAMIKGADLKITDSVFCWMPLTHDMGLIGLHLTALASSINQYIMPTALFVRRPSLWLKKVDEHKATFLAAPNFGYKHYLTYGHSEDNQYDLSHVRRILNGAEPISKNVCQNFLEVLASSGLKSNTLFPVYGLAEASLAVTFPPFDSEYKSIKVDRRYLDIAQEIKVIKGENKAHAIDFIGLGIAVNDCHYQILDHDYKSLNDQTVGHIYIKGKNVTQGYYHNDEATKAVIYDGWLKTGDLGFTSQGQLFVTGRVKDIIFVNGQNYYAHDIERVAEQVRGVELGNVVAFGANVNENEQVVLCLKKRGDERPFQSIIKAIKLEISEQIGIEIHSIVPVQAIPKTTSGKVQRYKLALNFKNGIYDDVLANLSKNQDKLVYDAPHTAIEKQLQTIWQSILHYDAIGIKVSFFELGGQSLKGALIGAEITELLKVNISLKELFTYPTIQQLAAYIEGQPQYNFDHIPIAKKAEFYPVTSAQKRIYVLSQIEKISKGYNMPGCFILRGIIDIDQIKIAFRALVKRHDILRTDFKLVNGEPVQMIHDSVDLPIQIVTCKAGEVMNVIRQEVGAFDLSSAPLVRLTLLKITKAHHVLVCDMHHIISDGFSSELLMKDFSNLYSSQKSLANLPIQYKDYAAWHYDQLISGTLDNQRKYWRTHLKGQLPVLELATDFDRPKTRSFEGETLVKHLPSEITNQLSSFLADQSTTIYIFFLSIFKILVAKYARQEDVIVGTPSSGRQHADTLNLVGLFVNTLVLRSQPKSTLKYNEYLSDLKALVIEAYTHQDYPFEDLVSDFKVQSSPNRNPLFDVLFSYQDNRSKTIKIDEVQFDLYEPELNISKFDLSLDVIESEQELSLRFEYSTALFKPERIEKMAEHFIQLTAEILKSPNQTIGAIDYLDTQKQSQLMAEASATKVEYGIQSVTSLFETQVKQQPNQTALKYNGETMSYLELNTAANQVALRLQEDGLQSEEIVAIILVPSFNMIVAVLGVLKAGGTYLPIDPNYPDNRLTYILEDCQTNFVLTTTELSKRITLQLPQILCFDNWEDSTLKTLENRLNDGHKRAYIIYTSGSTGQPKGVEIKHESFTDYIHTFTRLVNLTSADSILQHSSFSFDTSIEEIFPILCVGGCLILPNNRKDLTELTQYIEDGDLTALSVSPLILNYINTEVKTLGNLRLIISGGDELKPNYYQNLVGQLKLYNSYGPTESTVCISYYEIKGNEVVVPIGQPIANRNVYIMNDHQQLVPYGHAGELCVGGIGLAKGYLNNKMLTQSKFVANPYNADEVIYKTGDLAKWTIEGDLMFLGRIDSQVKIRGYRIELSGIETHLLNFSGIAQTVVLDKTDAGGQKFLCAYYVPNGTPTIAEILEFLKAYLPDYMIPSYFIEVESIPMTVNGKVNKRKLLKLSIDSDAENTQNYVAPTSELEKALVKVWEEVLNKTKVGVTDHFFESGGDSIKAMYMVSKIKKIGYETELKTLFQYTTIQALAKVIKKGGNTAILEIKPLLKREFYEASFAQKRLWLLDQIKSGTVDYNLSTHFEMSETVDINLMKKALQLITDRHEALRTNLINIEGEPKQKIHDTLTVEVPVYDFKSDTEDAFHQLFESESNYRFDLANDQLFRLSFIQQKEGVWRAIFVMHHIITDGWSMSVLKSEIFSTYEALVAHQTPVLTPLTIQYKDFAAWQNEWLSGAVLQAHKSFWLDTLGDELSDMKLPVTSNYQLTKRHTGSTYTYSINNATLTKLQQLANTTKSSLFMVMLSAYNILFSRLTGTADVLIGTPVMGRENEVLKDLIGFFLNTVILRSKVNPETQFNDYLIHLRNQTLEALKYQNYPFEQLVDDLNIPRNVNEFPMTSVFFNMLNIDEASETCITNFVPVHEVHNRPVKFDFNCYVSEQSNGISLTVDYKNERFTAETIEAIVRQYVQILEAIATSPEMLIKDIKTDQNKGIKPSIKTKKWYVQGETITSTFYKQVKQYSPQIAIQSLTDHVDYETLNSKSNQLAHYLANTFQERQRVAICLESSVSMAYAILGILKSGHTYVPIEPGYPEARAQLMLKETDSVGIITDQAHLKYVESLNLEGVIEMVCIDDFEARFNQCPTTNLTVNISDSDEAYILYTSGSTGMPKGVIQTHGAVLHFIANYSGYLNLTAQDRISGFSSVGFDSFNHEFYAALFNGGSYHPLSLKKGINISDLGDWINAHKISVFQSVPTVFRLFSNDILQSKTLLKTLRIVKMTGEATNSEDFNRFKGITTSKAKFIVSYGATESTLNTLAQYGHSSEITESILSPGYPINQTEIVIQNKFGGLTDQLESGEILVHSPYLMKGYVNNNHEDETAVFLEIDNKRYYNTGDFGRLTANGSLQILARQDAQVKIRGIRINLGEIENRLLSFKGVLQATVLAKEDKLGDPFLVAYFTANTSFESKALKNWLLDYLPDYMMPLAFEKLDEFPVTASGKIDKKALLKLTIAAVQATQAYCSPQTAIEIALVNLWETILDRKKIGVYDNFFELGGHSLKASLFVALANKNFNIKLPLKEVFTTPTIDQLALKIAALDQVDTANIEVINYDNQTYPLSSSQKRLFLLYLLDVNATNYNMPQMLEVKGPFNVKKAEYVFLNLIKRHDSLRTSFHMNADGPVQKIDDQTDFKLKHQSLKKNQLKQAFKAFIQPFDLSKSGLLRIEVIELNSKAFVLFIDMHHIISDGSTLQILVNDFVQLYQDHDLPELPIQYKDYTIWQQKFYEHNDFKAQKDYWLNQYLGGVPEPVNLPYDFKRPIEKTFEGNQFNYTINPKILNQFKAVLSETDTTLYMGLMAVYSIVLSKYSGQEDIVVGVPIAGRNHVDLKSVMGMFVNTLSLRNKPLPNLPFKSYLKTVKSGLIQAFENQDYPFEALVDELQLAKDLSRNPLFDTILVLQNVETILSDSIGGLSFHPVKYSMESSKFDLGLAFSEAKDELIAEVTYSTELFKVETVQRLMHHFEFIMSQVINTATKVGQIKLATLVEEQEILQLFNNTKRIYPIQEPIHIAFEQAVTKFKDHRAVTFNGKTLTYTELNQAANRVANTLISKGIQPGTRVGIIAEPSLEMIIGTFGILKAGAVYLPIDANYPVSRIEHMLKLSESTLVLTSHDHILPENLEIETILLSDNDKFSKDHTTPQVTVTLEDVAYVIFTSGSTGEPKGVEVQHKALLNLCHWHIEECNLTSSDHLSKYAGFGFDASIIEIFPGFLVGACLTIVPTEIRLEFKQLIKFFEKEQVSVAFLPTQVVENVMLYDCKSLRVLFTGGDKLKQYSKTTYTIKNQYGPSENTVATTNFDLDKEHDNIPIGQPAANTQVYILNDSLQLLPVGVPGEIYIGGNSLAKGYLNNPEETAKQFISNPFIKGERLYRSGDLGQWLNTGDLIFLGRKDNQVKIRGHRIELGEIEHHLLTYNQVLEAVVIPVINSNERQTLEAYFVAEETIESNVIKSFLAERLPEFMIPAVMTQIKQMPINANGKIDIQALSQFKQTSNVPAKRELPSSQLEQQIAKLWAEVLGVETIGITDNFF